MPHLPQSVHSKNFPCKTKSHFKPLFNGCYQVQFQKNLTYRFKLKVHKFFFKKKNNIAASSHLLMPVIVNSFKKPNGLI